MLKSLLYNSVGQFRRKTTDRRRRTPSSLQASTTLSVALGSEDTPGQPRSLVPKQGVGLSVHSFIQSTIQPTVIRLPGASGVTTDQTSQSSHPHVRKQRSKPPVMHAVRNRVTSEWAGAELGPPDRAWEAFLWRGHLGKLRPEGENRLWELSGSFPGRGNGRHQALRW